jgi:hypothetical protein
MIDKKYPNAERVRKLEFLFKRKIAVPKNDEAEG